MADPAQENRQILTDAAARQVPAVLSLPSAETLRHFKTRLLAETADGLWLEAPSAALAILERSDQRGVVAVSLCHAMRRLNFVSRIVRLESAHPINPQLHVQAVLVATPEQIKSVQRRAAYRVSVRSDGELRVRIWSIAPHARLADRPMAAQEIRAEVHDLSLGGLGVQLTSSAGDPLRLVADQRLRVELDFRGERFLLEGGLRLPKAGITSEVARAGIIFKKLEADIEGRRMLAALTRIVGELQREEARRMHLGLATPQSVPGVA